MESGGGKETVGSGHKRNAKIFERVGSKRLWWKHQRNGRKSLDRADVENNLYWCVRGSCVRDCFGRGGARSWLVV